MGLKINRILLSSDYERIKNSNKTTGNTDVIVQLDNKKKYIASFISYNHIDKINLEHAKNGEFLNGAYFWNKNMVLVKDCSLDIIEAIVKDLIDEGNFEEAFEKL